MSNQYGKKWTREETILAFDLYCNMPFSKVTKKNPRIIELATLIGRTPDSVVFKIGNLAHHDPKMIEKNIKGLSNTSKLDRLIVEEFFDNWEELSYQAKVILAERQQKQVQDLVPMDDLLEIPEGAYRDAVVKQRVGQYFFRNTVLMAYAGRCCVTGLNCSDLLVASHIKPWRDSDARTERTNPSNGLCLNALHDKAFDRGLITIDQKYRIIISTQLKNSNMDSDTKDWFEKYNGREILLPDKFLPGRDFIEYHNDVIFQR